MKIKELSELSNIEITSIKQLVKDNNSVYAIGVGVKGFSRELIPIHLEEAKKCFSRLGLEVILYPVEDIGLKFYKLEK